MLPQPTYSNCPLATLWLWLAGRAAIYWPCWLLYGGWQAWRRNRKH